MYGDFSNIFDDIAKAAKDFQQELSKYAQERHDFGNQTSYTGNDAGAEDYGWPPVNIYTVSDAIIFEFGLAGFDEDDIGLSFQGDYMMLSAVCRSALKNCAEQDGGGESRYLKKSLRLDNVEKQKYYVPADKYAQEKTSAVYKNGLLRVNVPLKEDDQTGGIKIAISS
jgi:HSP20 family molecular chaperone IbpA